MGWIHAGEKGKKEEVYEAGSPHETPTLLAPRQQAEKIQLWCVNPRSVLLGYGSLNSLQQHLSVSCLSVTRLILPAARSEVGLCPHLSVRTFVSSSLPTLRVQVGGWERRMHTLW